MIGLLVGGLLACTLKKTAPPMIATPEDAVEQAPPAGEIIDGRFVDQRLDFSIAAPASWRVEIWPGDGPLRVTLTHDSGAWVEAWAFAARLTEPAPRGDCSWDFIDDGHYRQPLAADLVATCMPDDPLKPRIYASLLYRGSITWQLEQHAPVAALSAGLTVTDALLETVRF